MTGRNDRQLNKAIKTLIAQYNNAVNNPMIRNPLAYALYQTWKKYDYNGDKG